MTRTSPRIALNGLGRIGKLVLRRLIDTGAAEGLVLVNEPAGRAEQHALLLEFDSVHGRWPAQIGHGADSLTVNGRHLRLTAARRFQDLPLTEMGIDIVLDCSGAFRKAADFAPCWDAGVRKVVVSAPVKDGGALNLVYGVNHGAYEPARHRIVTAASCTTNCLAPVVQVIHAGIGIRHGAITTLHDVTNTQTIVDRPAKDMRRARSALTNLIPTTTGSASAIGLIFPDLAGRLDGHAVRVPLLNASLTDCVFEVMRPTTVAEVNALLAAAAAGPLSGILGFETRPLVSSDYVNDPRSSIVDAGATMVTGGTQVKIFAWYDNEWGYACRLADVLSLVAGAL